MYHKILVPMALDHGVSPQTLRIARELAAEGAEIVGLHVHEAAQRSVRAYVDDDAEKDRLEGIARARLADMGAVTGQAATYCTVGRTEIARGSAIGQLLR